MRRFWPGLIFGAAIAALVVFVLGPLVKPAPGANLIRKGDALKEQAQVWWHKSRQKVGRGIEGMGDS